MNSSRLIFEHTLLLKPFVTKTQVNGFNVPEINKFITQQKPRVLVYFQKLIGVQISNIKIESPKFYENPTNYRADYSIFEHALIRLKDLVPLLNVVSGPGIQKFIEVDNAVKKFRSYVLLDSEYRKFSQDINNLMFRLGDRGYISNEVHDKNVAGLKA